MLVVAIGLLPFDADHLLIGPRPAEWVVLVGAMALLSLAWSIALGLWCNINRLYDFHASAQVSRRNASKGRAAADIDLEPKVVGEAAWLLVRLQLILFVVGAASSAVALLFRA
jgi:hypothetical protein